MITDEAFRREFASNPALASIATGLDLLPEELEALLRGPHDMLDRLASCLDGRICRLSVSDRKEPS